MKDETGRGTADLYVPPEITDFGKVSLVTASTGMTFLTDSNFNGSMEFPGMGSGTG